MAHARSGAAALCIALAAIPWSASMLRAADSPLAVAAPMSGPLADSGKSIAAGVTLAVEDANARKGLAGTKIATTIFDDRGDIAGAARAAEEIAARRQSIVIGHYTSVATLAAANIYARHGILLVAPAASIPRLTKTGNALVLRLAPLEDAQGRFAGQYLSHLFPRSPVAIVTDGSAAAKLQANAARRAIAGARMPEPLGIAIEPGPAGQRALANQAKALAARKAKAVYWSGGAANLAAFATALRTSGSTALILTSDAVATPEFAAGGDAIEGIRMTIPRDISQLDSARPVALRLLASGVRDIPLALTSYAGVQILEKAAAHTGSSDPARLASFLRGGLPVETIAGPVSFDADGDRKETLFSVAIWKKAADGKFIFVPE